MSRFFFSTPFRKELKIKEGAENLRKATTDRKSLAHVNSLVKLSNTKLNRLQDRVNELTSDILVIAGQINSSAPTNRVSVNHLCSTFARKSKE